MKEIYTVEGNNFIKSFCCFQTLIYTVLMTFLHYFISKFYHIDDINFLHSLAYSYCFAVSLPLIGILENFLKSKFISIVGNSFIIFSLISGHNFYYDLIALLFFVSTISKIRQIFNQNIIPVYIKWIPGCAQQIIEYNRSKASSLAGEYRNDDEYHDDVGIMGLKIKDSLKKNIGFGKVFIIAFFMLSLIHYLPFIHIHEVVIGGPLKLSFQILVVIINLLLINLYLTLRIMLNTVQYIRGDQNSMSWMLIVLFLTLFLFLASYNYIFLGFIGIIVGLFFDTIVYYFKNFKKNESFQCSNDN